MTLRLPLSPITAELYKELPLGPPYYELIKGNLIRWPDENAPLRLPARPVTAEFYRRMPVGPPYYQLIKGNLVMSPSPNFFHQRIVIRLIRLIEAYLEETGIGVLSTAPSDVYLDGINVFQPDIYYVSNERRHLVIEGGLEGAPDLIVEILSPSNSSHDRKEKREAYAKGGVKELWIIDPEAKQVEIHLLPLGLNAAPRILIEPELLTTPQLPGLEIDLIRLFQSIN